MTKRIVGAGEFTYEVIYPFGQMPTISSEGRITHVAVDSKDRVYAFLRAEVPILVFDPDGNLLTTWGEGLFLAGHGIYISPSDEVFLIDWDGHEVMKFDANGKLLLRFGNRGRPAFQAPFNHPADVAVAPSGEIYIADGYANSNVHRFSAEGKHLGSWGTPGSGPGQFSTPHGIWVDGNERVYVADRENSRVQIFSPEEITFRNGATCTMPWTFTRTVRAGFSLPTRHRGSQCLTRMVNSSAGERRPPRPTASGETPRRICTSGTPGR